MKTILVTGGSGYIGSVVCHYLSKDNIVINIDTKERPLPGVIQYITNINSKVTDAAIKKNKPDAVIHLAADHSVPKSLKDPKGTYTNNVSNTIALLNSCVKHNIKNFIYSSSSSVYGHAGTIDPLVGMQSFIESQKPNPLTPYSRSKIMIEDILKDYGSAYGINHASLRYFNAAGSFEGQYGYQIDPPEHLLPILVERAFTNGEFTINGTNYNTPDGTCVRDYTHVSDIAKAHIAAVDYLLNGNPSTVVNLGSNSPKSIMEVIKEIEQQTDKYICTVNGLRRDGDMEYTFANINKAKSIFKWCPQHTFQDIIRDEINWYKQTH